MPRQVWLWGVGLGLVALALAVTDWLLFRLPGVHEANVRRIREGMTLHEVETILDGPPETNYRDNVASKWIRAWPDGRGNWVWVEFDDQGRVTLAEFQQAGTSFLRRFRSWRSFCSWLAG
jgi:hypothetical protein